MRFLTYALGLVLLVGIVWFVWGSGRMPATAPNQARAPTLEPSTATVAPPPSLSTSAGRVGPADGVLGPAPALGASAEPISAEPLPPAVQAVNEATFSPASAKPPKAAAFDPVLLRAQVLLDRAGFSPGVIDGKNGENVRRALAAFAAAKGLPAKGDLDKPVWDGLTSQDPAPVIQAYQITAADAAGPFIGEPPKDYQALAKLPALSYSSPVQLLAEKFHMDEGLLKSLNPAAAFDKAGTTILVAAPRQAPRAFKAARLEVDKLANQVRVYGADGALLATYPASVGSAERPAPSGVFEVRAVAPAPAYYYDPARLTFQPEGAKGKLKIAPGPNNPVGSTWIALTAETYGIHGSPEPETIGKRQSHGCVRLTNWDAAELGKAVSKGVKVSFVGREAKAKA